MRLLGLFTDKTFRKHLKLIFPQRDFIIRIVSLAIFHPHFSIRILPSAFFYPPSAIRHPPSAIRHPPSAIRYALYRDPLRPYVSSVFSGRIRKFLKTLSRVEIFLSDTNTYTCGRSYPEICENAYVILLDPVFTTSIINKHGVQQGFSFFVSCSDFWFDIIRSDKCSCDKFTQLIY